MADKDNGTFLVYLCQKLIEAGFKAFIDISAWFVENENRRITDNGTS